MELDEETFFFYFEKRRGELNFFIEGSLNYEKRD